ncbi:MAG: GNAT family N-acetyltransferase [Gemmatimonadales bacterium]
MPGSTPLETERLTLLAASPAQYLALLEDPERFEQLAGLALADGLRGLYTSGEISPRWIAALRAAPAPDPWRHGFWITERGGQEVVGSAGFKGPPDADGVVEIAYGLAPSREGRGYATEAAAALVRFASADARVRVVRAHTLPEANASTRVLRKCGFVHIGDVVDPEDGPVWRWERSPQHIGAP